MIVYYVKIIGEHRTYIDVEHKFNSELEAFDWARNYVAINDWCLDFEIIEVEW